MELRRRGSSRRREEDLQSTTQTRSPRPRPNGKKRGRPAKIDVTKLKPVKFKTVKHETLTCAHCDLPFEDADEFSDHIERSHPHICPHTDHCDLAFTTALELETHIQGVHDVEKKEREELEPTECGTRDDSILCKKCAPKVNEIVRKCEDQLDSENITDSEGDQSQGVTENDDTGFCPSCAPKLKKFAENIERRICEMLENI